MEVNGTYYSSQKPATLRSGATKLLTILFFHSRPNRFATQRRVLGEAGDSIRRFVDSGIAELRHKLGPIVWQLPPTKRFDADDLEAFFNLLPPAVDALPLRHVLDARHASFLTPHYLALARKYRVATVFTDSDDHPSFANLTASDLVYVRLMRSNGDLPAGFEPAVLDQYAVCARAWAQGQWPHNLPCIEEDADPALASSRPRDVFMFFIAGAKERAPAAAMALLGALSR